MPFSGKCFLHHYGVQLKTAVEKDEGEKIHCNLTKWKRNKNLKMPRFCAVFNSSSRVNREKDKTNLFTVFPKLLKIMVMKGKVVSSSFQDIFNREKAKKNKNKNQNNVFCLSFIGFCIQSSQYQTWKAGTYSILTNGNRTWAASVGSLN